jgi:hypothetical protein
MACFRNHITARPHKFIGKPSRSQTKTPAN